MSNDDPDGFHQAIHDEATSAPAPTVTEGKCSECRHCTEEEFRGPRCNDDCRRPSSPTVTIPREEWERMQAESEAWKATIKAYLPDKPTERWLVNSCGVVFDVIDAEIERLLTLSQPNAAEGE